MKEINKWRPTKFIFDKKGRFVANRDYVSSKSLLVVNKVALLYKRFLEDHASGTLLDLGCGTAPLFGVYKDMVERTICIDWVNSPHQNIHLDYEADLNKKVPLKSNSVDTVLLSDVLEHINEPQKLMSEISRVLRPHGKLILGVPFLYWIHEEPYDFHRYTMYQLKYLCAQNDLEILELHEWGGSLSVVCDMFGKHLPSTLSATFQRIAIWLIETRLGKRIEGITQKKFPLGYSLVASRK